MMRPSSVLLVSLLALSLLVTGTQGIRFKMGLLSFGHDQPAEIHESKKMSNMMETSHEDGSVGESITGMNRKLITTTTTTSSSSPTTTSEINEKNEENKANPRSSTSSSESKSSDHGEITSGTNSPPPSTSDQNKSSDDEISHDHYHVDITDITEMDYSPARRKPPIHN